MLKPEECFWKGRPITELTREQLLEVCCFMFTQRQHDRAELSRRLDAMDVRKYLTNGGYSA